MTATTTGTLKVPGASLYYEVRGSGPLLLLVAGAPADAGTFAALADQLADRHTVVTYDWRGAARSPLDGPADDPAEGLPMQMQGDDAELLLAALADGPARVLGCSGGALVGLDLVAHHPERVEVLVAHEPPAMNLLADGAGWRAAFQEVEETYRREEVGPGMQRFIATVARTGGPAPAEGHAASPGQQQAPPVPDPSQLPPEVLEGMARMQANSEFLLAHLLPTTIGHVPDVARLQEVPSRIVVGVGAASQGQMPHLAALALAECLGSDAVEFPGDHQGFASHPGPFAAALGVAASHGCGGLDRVGALLRVQGWVRTA
jgi:pimeloyl-ACP methyl ester carboxylesterase